MEGLLLLLRCGRAQEDNLSEPGAQDPEPSLSDDNIRKRAMMNWDQIAGRWKQSKGKTREGWGRFTDDDSSQIEGRREQMDGFLQESFGMIKELAKKQIHEFLESHPDFYVAHQRTAKQH